MEKSNSRLTAVAVKLNKDEVDLVNRLCDYYVLSRSEILRHAIAYLAEVSEMDLPEKLKNETTT